MTRKDIIEQIRKKSSFLCIGLDTDLQKIPQHLLKSADPVFEFNKAIIDATADLCIAYKPNLAFYEKLGPRGLESLKKTVEYIPAEIFKIADAKRGDIGNTSQMYADAFFNFYGFDAVTVAPYMGKDSVGPFLGFDNKWTILLALTSNQGSSDFQLSRIHTGEKLFEHVIAESRNWAGPEKMMYVTGATRAEYLTGIRNLIPDHFLLVPGIGTQGGDLESVIKYGMTSDVGLIINASRSILYASSDRSFKGRVRSEATALKDKMNIVLGNYS